VIYNLGTSLSIYIYQESQQLTIHEYIDLLDIIRQEDMHTWLIRPLHIKSPITIGPKLYEISVRYFRSRVKISIDANN